MGTTGKDLGPIGTFTIYPPLLSPAPVATGISQAAIKEIHSFDAKASVARVASTEGALGVEVRTVVPTCSYDSSGYGNKFIIAGLYNIYTIIYIYEYLPPKSKLSDSQDIVIECHRLIYFFRAWMPRSVFQQGYW